MTYRVDVINDGDADGTPRFLPCFFNFVDSVGGLSGPWIKELRQHNCRNVSGTDYIEFESEEDYIIFKLRFS
jgi:hypothetical protein